MDAKDAMIVWQPAAAAAANQLPGGLGRLRWEPGTVRPQVRVFHNDDGNSHDRFDGLPCSLGVCLAGWCAEDAMADIFRAFLCVIGDGVPLAQAHREFLKIDEYKAMCGETEFFGVQLAALEF